MEISKEWGFTSYFPYNHPRLLFFWTWKVYLISNNDSCIVKVYLSLFYSVV